MNDLEYNEIQDLRSQLIQHLESEIQLVQRVQQLTDTQIAILDLGNSEPNLLEFRRKVLQLVIAAAPTEKP